jgi:2-furoyl-CoA dehydrogenase large subunit
VVAGLDTSKDAWSIAAGNCAKGVAEGNAMSTPVCIANAVADALGVAEITRRMFSRLSAWTRTQPRASEAPGPAR